MGVLEEITRLRDQGFPDENIIRDLQERGVSPRAINDAMSQAEIKKAVTGQTQYQEEGAQPQGQGYEEQSFGTQEVNNEGYIPSVQQEYYPQDQSGYDQDYSQGYGGMDTSTIIEIAEQVFSEKIQKIQKQVGELIEFKTLMESKVEHLIDRVKRVENMVDKTQMAILDKVGSYGKGLDNVKKEINMMQDSFGKMVPSLAEKAKHRQTNTIKKFKKTSKKK